MTMEQLSIALLFPLVVLAIFDWLSTGILVRAALIKPRIRALSERAFLSVVLSIAVTTYLITATAASFELIEIAEIRLAARAIFVGLALTPILWLYLYVRRKF